MRRLLSIFRSRHTLATVVEQLVEGFETGRILLDPAEVEARGTNDALNAQGKTDELVESLGSAATKYAHAGQFTRASQAFESLLLHSEGVSRHTRAATLFSLATVHALQGESDLAIDRYKQALSLFRELDDNAGMLRTLSRLGTVYSMRSERLIALVILEEAVALSERTGDVSERGIIFYNLVSTYLKLNELDRATAALKRMAAFTSVAPSYDSVQTNPAFAHPF